MPEFNYSDIKNKIFNFGTVISVDDKSMLNRVRIELDTENNKAILEAIPNTKNGKQTKENGKLKEEFWWSDIDYFCFLPLLPWFINVTPKVGETVNIFYPNPNLKFDEQYYMPGIFSSPATTFYENSNSQRAFAARTQIIEPKSLKNPITNDYYNKKSKGIFVEPEDVGILGRGTADIIIKDEHVILRAGKSTNLPKYADKDMEINTKRSFIQLSNFRERTTLDEDVTTVRLQKVVSYTKSLIEWNVINPENTHNKFTYTVNLYSLPEKSGYTTENLQIDTNVENADKSLVYSATFNNESIDSMVKIILRFIGQCADGTINLPPVPIQEISNQFPIFFRPAANIIKLSEDPTNGDAYINLTTIINKIDYKGQNNGYGLIWSATETGQQTTPRVTVQKNPKTNTNSTITYNVLGADKLVLLSHESKIPGTEGIQVKDETVYGMEQNYLVMNVLPNTNAMVRGEQLISFLNLIVRFLQSHTHAFPGLPPVPIAHDGTSVAEILQQLANASNTILNQNIRIN